MTYIQLYKDICDHGKLRHHGLCTELNYTDLAFNKEKMRVVICFQIIM